MGRVGSRYRFRHGLVMEVNYSLLSFQVDGGTVNAHSCPLSLCPRIPRGHHHSTQLLKIWTESVKDDLSSEPWWLQALCRVSISHARVAQKSYGNEKRFFCPPPCVVICGNGWNLRRQQLLAQGLSPEAASLTGTLGVEGGQGSPDPLHLSHDDDAGMTFACAKSLYISDTDRRKTFQLALKLRHAGGQPIGTFLGSPIRVISKPSKKKQGARHGELAVVSGSHVALFSRLRSQTVSTRFLLATPPIFTGSARRWASLLLHVVSDQQSRESELSTMEGVVRYGATIQLVCTLTGLALPPLVVRRVERGTASLQCTEPVSQLHKVALQVSGKDLYLGLVGHSVIFAQLSSVGDGARLEILGEGLDTGLCICFGEIPMETVFRPPNSLICTVPDVSAFSSDDLQTRPLRVPLSLSRPHDSLTFPTHFTITFSPENPLLTLTPRQNQALPPRNTSAYPRVAGGKWTGSQKTMDAWLSALHDEFSKSRFNLS
uniref:Recombination signal binding protein for immunoglobulin kappa J region-like n=1 Tax=Eptatretus burgeri TaxID=7764 RepID=A0A8C4QN65_EPTBU